jgi:hypothetical protein
MCELCMIVSSSSAGTIAHWQALKLKPGRPGNYRTSLKNGKIDRLNADRCVDPRRVV